MPPCCGLPVSSHQMTRHGTNRDYRPTLPARHSLSLSLCISFPQPRQPRTVHRFGPVSGPRPTGVTGHANCLPDISPQAHPVEDGYQVAESTLDPGGVRRDDHTVVCVKNRQLVSSLPFLSPFSSALSTIPSIQCRTTASTTTLKMVANSGSPCVTTLAPLNALP